MSHLPNKLQSASKYTVASDKIIPQGQPVKFSNGGVCSINMQEVELSVEDITEQVIEKVLCVIPLSLTKQFVIYQKISDASNVGYAIIHNISNNTVTPATPISLTNVTISANGYKINAGKVCVSILQDVQKIFIFEIDESDVITIASQTSLAIDTYGYSQIEKITDSKFAMAKQQTPTDVWRTISLQIITISEANTLTAVETQTEYSAGLPGKIQRLTDSYIMYVGIIPTYTQLGSTDDITISKYKIETNNTLTRIDSNKLLIDSKAYYQEPIPKQQTFMSTGGGTSSNTSSMVSFDLSLYKSQIPPIITMNSPIFIDFVVLSETESVIITTRKTRESINSPLLDYTEIRLIKNDTMTIKFSTLISGYESETDLRAIKINDTRVMIQRMLQSPTKVKLLSVVQDTITLNEEIDITEIGNIITRTYSVVVDKSVIEYTLQAENKTSVKIISTTQKPPEYVLGFSKSYAKGGEMLFVDNGYEIGVFSGLKKGKTYYLSDDGTLTDVKQNSEIKIGIAITESKIKRLF